MRTIIINGSPKGKKGNTEIFIQNFTKEMKKGVLIKRIIEEDYEELARLVKEYDSIIIVLPLYIHSMPGIVMRFLERLEVNNPEEEKQLGIILQYGFPEGFQGEYLERYFESLAEELNMKYLGALVKPESAAVYTLPKIMTQKLFKLLKRFGEIYEETHVFDKTIIKELKKPYRITGKKLKFMQFIRKIGLMNVFWNKFLKDNHAFEKRYDRPFI